MSSKLSIPTVLLHWVVGLAFIGVFALGLYLEELAQGPEKFELMGIHKSIGLGILLIALLRISWRLKEGHLARLTHAPAWQEWLAKGVHFILLFATIMMPISGLVMSYGSGRAIEFFGIELLAAGDKIEWLSEIGHTFHGVAPKLIMLAFALHIIGAIKHQFIDKDGTISRMLGRSVTLK